jgi:hypothetical protein
MRAHVLQRPALATCLALAPALLSGCEALVPFHRLSAEYYVERTAIVLETVDAKDSEPGAVVVPRDGRQASLGGDPLEFESRLQKLVATTAAHSPRAPSAWSARVAGDFYAAEPRVLDPAVRGEHGILVEVRPALQGFRVERWLGDDRVTTLDFAVQLVDGAFLVTLERVCVDYSRAKVADTSWRNWWTRIPLIYGFGFDVARVFGTEYTDDAVDLHVDLQFTASWTDEDGENHFAPLALFGWTVLDVELGASSREVGKTSGWLPLIPPSIAGTAGTQPRYGKGRFTLSALVTEQDDLSPEYIETRESMGQYIDDILGILPIPGLPGTVP